MMRLPIAVLAALAFDADADMSAVGREADIPNIASNRGDWRLKLSLIESHNRGANNAGSEPGI